ncbi:hypothetical protein J0H58_27195 [bacterium]|nr:hypothetical protein [bacterium]
MRTIALALAALVGAAAPARADEIPQFVGVPGTYVATVPFTFELRAPGLSAFTDFSVNLIVETPGLDPVALVAVIAERPGDGEYVFGAAGTFSTSQSAVDGSPTFTVSIAGTSGGSGVSTVAGANDVLARITVTPAAGLTDPITFSIDASGYTFSALSESGQSLQPPAPVTVFLDDTPPPTSPVPGPGGVVLMGFGGLLVVARGRLLRWA